MLSSYSWSIQGHHSTYKDIPCRMLVNAYQIIWYREQVRRACRECSHVSLPVYMLLVVLIPSCFHPSGTRAFYSVSSQNSNFTKQQIKGLTHMVRGEGAPGGQPGRAIFGKGNTSEGVIRPVHLLRVVLIRVLESNFPGDHLSNATDMIIPIPEN